MLDTYVFDHVCYRLVGVVCVVVVESVDLEPEDVLVVRRVPQEALHDVVGVVM